MKQFLGQPFDGSSKDEQNRRHQRGKSQQFPVTQTANDAEHSANPNRRGRRQAGDVTHWVAQDNSGTDETDAGQDSLDHSSDGVSICQPQTALRPAANDRGNSSSNANQCVRAQAGSFSVELSIQSENGTDNERGSETQSCLFSLAQHKTMLCWTGRQKQAFSE
jgi:hypothetical protein